MFRSKLEEQVADILFDNQVEYEYEETKLKYVLEKNYIPDFKLTNGTYWEVKGFWDSADRKKVKTVIEQYPTLTSFSVCNKCAANCLVQDDFPIPVPAQIVIRVPYSIPPLISCKPLNGYSWSHDFPGVVIICLRSFPETIPSGV